MTRWQRVSTPFLEAWINALEIMLEREPKLRDPKYPQVALLTFLKRQLAKRSEPCPIQK